MRCMTTIAVLAVVISGLLFPVQSALAEGDCSIFVVMSYHEDFPWSQEVKQGLDAGLAGRCSAEYFYLDTKLHPENGEALAQEALSRYQELAPDLVIAADDNAQSMFVVPYLKDNADTPVVFCGVNAEPEAYGYPASNVTGVLERFLVCRSLELLKEIAPEVEKVAFLMRGGLTTTDLLYNQIKADIGGCDFAAVGYAEPETLAEAVAQAQAFAETSDALFLEHVEGLPDANGNALSTSDAVAAILAAYGAKPSTGGSDFTVRDGVLCSVVDSGKEQGSLAAEMALQILDGAAVADLPIIRNHTGRVVVNAATLEELVLSLPESVGEEAVLVGQ
ncbi:MAG: hypothetical protein D6E12_09050 [Desulfovibrio sp.]|nr:MAG: hypothetical protein D6E12_09050 [Desulfovibrio sp.]